MRFRPRTFSDVTHTMTQQQRLQLMTGTHAGAQCVLSRPGQIADRLIGLFGYQYRRQVARSSKVRELQGISAVGFDPIAGFAWDLRRRQNGEGHIV
jgi:hypothetical protein